MSTDEKFGLGILFVLSFALAFVMGINIGRHTTVHKCHSPCTVSLPKNTEEDMFKIDYHDTKLDVWVPVVVKH